MYVHVNVLGPVQDRFLYVPDAEGTQGISDGWCEDATTFAAYKQWKGLVYSGATLLAFRNWYSKAVNYPPELGIINGLITNISKANPAVVTVGSAFIRQAVLTNGDTVAIAGVPAPVDTALNGNKVVAGVNLAAGTFTCGADTSAAVGTSWTGGNVTKVVT